MRRPGSRSFKSLIRGGYVRIVLIFVNITIRGEGERTRRILKEKKKKNRFFLFFSWPKIRENVYNNKRVRVRDDESVDEKRKKKKEREREREFANETRLGDRARTG